MRLGRLVCLGDRSRHSGWYGDRNGGTGDQMRCAAPTAGCGVSGRRVWGWRWSDWRLRQWVRWMSCLGTLRNLRLVGPAAFFLKQLAQVRQIVPCFRITFEQHPDDLPLLLLHVMCLRKEERDCRAVHERPKNLTGQCFSLPLRHFRIRWRRRLLLILHLRARLVPMLRMMRNWRCHVRRRLALALWWITRERTMRRSGGEGWC